MFGFYQPFVAAIHSQPLINATLAFTRRPAFNPLLRRFALCGLPLFFYTTHKVYCLGL